MSDRPLVTTSNTPDVTQRLRITQESLVVSAANAALLALQRRIDRAREALDLGNVERAKAVLRGED